MHSSGLSQKRERKILQAYPAFPHSRKTFLPTNTQHWQMGVYHFAGLGTSPGAVTTPLTTIYLLLKAAENGNEDAANFFRYSGEAGQERRGAPENLLLFTSQEIIGGMNVNRQLKSTLFPNQSYTGRVTKILHKHLKRLTEELSLTNIYREGWVKKIYLVRVKHLDFDDCYTTANTFIYGCKEKECWINTQAGTNQINTSLIISSSYNLTAGKFYYIKQTQTELLDPDFLKPEALKNPEKHVGQLLSAWGELPIIGLGLHEALRELSTLFEKKGKVNKSELEEILENHGLGRTAIAKLRPYLEITGNTVAKSERFDRLTQVFTNRWPRGQQCVNLWRAAKERNVLYEIDVDTGDVKEA